MPISAAILSYPGWMHQNFLKSDPANRSRNTSKAAPRCLIPTLPTSAAPTSPSTTTTSTSTTGSGPTGFRHARLTGRVLQETKTIVLDLTGLRVTNCPCQRQRVRYSTRGKKLRLITRRCRRTSRCASTSPTSGTRSPRSGPGRRRLGGARRRCPRRRQPGRWTSTWFPCNDHPSDKSKYRIRVLTESEISSCPTANSSIRSAKPDAHCGPTNPGLRWPPTWQRCKSGATGTPSSRPRTAPRTSRSPWGSTRASIGPRHRRGCRSSTP
ncbi:hypothetical protein SCANM63S_03363 [Streptomyces canarius]